MQLRARHRLRIDHHSKIDINSGSGTLLSPALELPMISVASREKTVLRPRRLPLVQTEPSFLSLAPRTRYGPAHSNTSEMILLRDTKAKPPGIISLHNMNRLAGVVKCKNRRNFIRICRLYENSSRNGRLRKPFRMTTFANPSRQLP